MIKYDTKFLEEWNHEGISYRSFVIPREEIDSNSNKIDALLIESSAHNGKMCYDFFDPYDKRMVGYDIVILTQYLDHAPTETEHFIWDILDYLK